MRVRKTICQLFYGKLKISISITVISSICDVGNAISSFDIKTSVETWRTVAKLSEKYKKLPFKDTVDNVQWYSTAISGIFKELNLLINIFNQVSPILKYK